MIITMEMWIEYFGGKLLHYLQNLDESIIRTVVPQSNDNKDSWSFARVQFPEGFYQVVIQGIRPDTNEASGVALDDIFIAPCDEFRKWHHLLLVISFPNNNTLKRQGHFLTT